MKQHHGPQDIRVYSLGANRDTEDEFLTGTQGEYVDGCNMRPTSMDGDSAAHKKIKGEELLHDNSFFLCQTQTTVGVVGNMECIGKAEINDRKVSFWADRDVAFDPLIVVDDKLVLRSPDFPINVAHPLQIHKNESCIGGEVYITDYDNKPMLFNIKDLLINAGVAVGDEPGDCSEKYFANFNLSEHTLDLEQPADHPVFIDLENLGSGGGLPVGYYQYSHRYVLTGGDRTQWSVSTPLIPVPTEAGSESDQYPFIKSFSRDPNVAFCTKFGVRIRLRITNVNNFDFIEIRRIRYNNGDVVGSLPTVEVLDVPATVSLVQPGEISIREFTDNCDVAIKETLTNEEPTDVMSSVRRAKAIRYFNQRLYLMNVEFESRDIEDTYDELEINGNKVYPAIHAMGKAGHNDPFELTYFKSYMHRERFGIGIVGFDSKGERTFARPLEGEDSNNNSYNNYLIPSRRERITSDTRDISYFGAAHAATNDGILVAPFTDETHEVFDNVNAISKTDKCSFKNILNTDGGKQESNLTQSILSDCDTDFSGCKNILGQVQADSTCVGYQPYHPVSDNDNDVSGHDYWVNIEVHNGSNFVKYEPDGFGLNYFSTGLTLAGIDNIPSFMKAFSIVRTQGAGRTACQGIGYYALETAEGAFGANVGKFTNKVWFHSPDVDHGIFDMQNVIDNPDDFEIEVESPLGFFTEMYDGDRSLFDLNAHRGIDMITYCRVLFDDGSINVGDSIINVGTLGYPAFGKWRSPLPPTGAFTNLTNKDINGDQITFTINQVQERTSGRGTYFEIETDQDIFSHPTAGGDHDFEDLNVKKWHEPVYMINIIRKGKTVPEQDVTEFIDTGHYQKVESIIGRSSQADDQTFLLVDERWEDCIRDLPAQVNNGFSALHRFVFIRNEIGEEARWLNVTGFAGPTVISILTDLQNNVPVIFDGFEIFGIYVNEHVGNQVRTFRINFGAQSIEDINTSPTAAAILAFPQQFYIPPENNLIIVRYDNRIPIRFFGGDSSIGESVFAPLDNQYDSNNRPVDDNNDFRINVGFPYKGFHINPRSFLINSTTGINKIQDNNEIFLDKGVINIGPARIRQLVAMYTVESRINMPYAFNGTSAPDEYFPLIHYVIRPHKWDANAALPFPDNNIFDPEYEDDYGSQEFGNWGFGGFRFLPQTNIDYSHEPNFRVYESKAQVGFEEKNLFCTRIIWSALRPINIQDAVGVRTFPALNFFDISDDTGEIKFAWSTETGPRGENLYCITDGGICLNMVDKRIINEINGNNLATIGSEDIGVLKQIWLTKSIGMDDEMWRSGAEYNNKLWFANHNSAFSFDGASLPKDIGREKYHSRLFGSFLQDYPPSFDQHLTGVYDVLHDEYWLSSRAIGGRVGGGVVREETFDNLLEVVDTQFDPNPVDLDSRIGVNTGDTVIITPLSPNLPVWLGGVNNLLIQLAEDFKICVAEDALFSIEVKYFAGEGPGTIELVTVQPGECFCIDALIEGGKLNSYVAERCPLAPLDCQTFVWSEKTQHWLGTYDYAFDQFLSFDNKMFGLRDMQTFELHKGNMINDELIEASVVGAASPDQVKDKEFIRIRINSDNKPEKVEFFDTLSQVDNNDPQAVLDTNTNPLALKDYYGFEQFIPRKTLSPFNRMQGRLLLYRISHKLDEDFKIMSSAITYKPLK